MQRSDPIRSASSHFRWYYSSDIGMVRQENQDAVFGEPETGLFIVADGLGGHQAGALAARIVVEVLPKMLASRFAKINMDSVRVIRYWLRQEIMRLSRQLRAQSLLQPSTFGMGATLILAFIQNDKVHIAHAGDSRAYLFRENKLVRLTEDHSIISILLRARDITPEAARFHPAHGQLTRYVGMEGTLYSDVQTISIESKDRLLLCTDGLTGMLPDEAISDLLNKCPDPRTACQVLTAAANHAGGYDNVTEILLQWE